MGRVERKKSNENDEERKESSIPPNIQNIGTKTKEERKKNLKKENIFQSEWKMMGEISTHHDLIEGKKVSDEGINERQKEKKDSWDGNELLSPAGVKGRMQGCRVWEVSVLRAFSKASRVSKNRRADRKFPLDAPDVLDCTESAVMG